MLIVLPFPPSLNKCWRNVMIKTRNGYVPRTLLSSVARDYRARAIIEIKQQHPGHATIDYPVKVRIDLFPATNRKMDVDNYAKSVLDALTHSNVWVDDVLVHDLRLVKHEKERNSPRAVVHILML